MTESGLTPPHIADYAAIGDGRSAALVAKDGGIDWLCWPRFDSPSLFAAILDFESGGRFLVRPRGTLRTRRRYLGHSNVLSTRFETARGRGRLIDLMPVASEEAKREELMPEHEILRVLECELGELDVDIVFQPRPGYARSPVTLCPLGPLGIRVEDGASLYTLRCDAPLKIRRDGIAYGAVRLRAGQRLHLSLTYAEEGPAVLPPLKARAPLAIARSVSWWQRWSARCKYVGPYRDAVVRSLLVLKLMSFAPSGAIVAAPTTSLPEVPGGWHNWDYRFCWLRDASLTVTALHDLGYELDAAAFLDWLIHTTALTRPELRVVYDVYGRAPHHEVELPNLSGHLDSRPVRVRNAAVHQLQLDIYGEVIDAVTHLVRRGVPLSRASQKMVRQLGRFVLEHWREPDQGIWEPREAPQRHTHSLLLSWVACQRLLDLHARDAIGPLDTAELERARDEMRHLLETRAWNEAIGSYTSVLDGDAVDAALLLMSWYGFEPASSARQRFTFERIRERLEKSPALIERWEGAPDAAFGICCFWAVQQLADGAGSLAEAEERFVKLLGCANDVGLFAEETDPVDHAALGNFPQAFTHIGLIQAALALERRRALDARAKEAA